MPFDGANYGSEVLRLLRRACDRIARGQWVQGRLKVRELSNVYHFCMLGAIMCEDDGEERCNTDTIAATVVVGKALGSRSKSPAMIQGEIAGRNDSSRTGRRDVEAILRTAVRLQELEEFGTSMPAK